MRWPRRTHVAAKVVLRDGIGRVLVLRRSGTDPRRPYTWDLPGGTVEFGTDPADAVLREVREETGIGTLAGLRPLGVESSYGREARAKGRSRRQYVIRLVFTAVTDTAPLGRYAPVVPVLSRLPPGSPGLYRRARESGLIGTRIPPARMAGGIRACLDTALVLPP